MKRLKYLFAGCLLLLAMPMWRYLDLVPIVVPFDLLYVAVMSIWFAVFIMIPAKLVFTRLKTSLAIGLIVLAGLLAWIAKPLSKMASLDSTFNHCGALTFTGTFYPLRSLLTDAYRDDLEARNQLCWVRKMISRVPEKIESEHEVEVYSKLIKDRLLAPEIKYRASLPLITFLIIKINSVNRSLPAAKNILESSNFWHDQYTEEISHRTYSFWNWPHSDYIKLEYGFVEENWQKLIDGIIIN